MLNGRKRLPLQTFMWRLEDKRKISQPKIDSMVNKQQRVLNIRHKKYPGSTTICIKPFNTEGRDLCPTYDVRPKRN